MNHQQTTVCKRLILSTDKLRYNHEMKHWLIWVTILESVQFIIVYSYNCLLLVHNMSSWHATQEKENENDCGYKDTCSSEVPNITFSVSRKEKSFNSLKRYSSYVLCCFYRNVLNPFAADNTLACGIRFECAKRIIMYIRVEDFRVNLIEGLQNTFLWYW